MVKYKMAGELLAADADVDSVTAAADCAVGGCEAGACGALNPQARLAIVNKARKKIGFMVCSFFLKYTGTA
jgi:hypothetical protein